MFTEFFAGIGGFSACLPHIDGGLAIDINRRALDVLQRNCRSRVWCKTIESLEVDDLNDAPKQFWWMSPPCQPYTAQGLGRDLDDPRSTGLRNLISLIQAIRPSCLALENVPAFSGSRSRQLLLEALASTGYEYQEMELCPSDFGFVNRRQRYYLIASRSGFVSELPDLSGLAKECNSTPALQEDFDFESFLVPPAWLERYGEKLHIVSETAFLAGDVQTKCFTAAYGRSPLRAGSLLETRHGVRFFTPAEILWQLGFPADWRLPDWSAEKLWPLTGNTLSLPAVKYCLARFSPPPGSDPATGSPVQPNTQL